MSKENGNGNNTGNNAGAQGQPEGETKETEKKENFLKRGFKKVVNGMKNHPFWTAFGSAAVGSGLTIGAGELGKHIAQNRRAAKQPVVQHEVNTLDPNQ